MVLLFCSACSCLSIAHEVRPSLLTLTQTEPGVWHAVFKQPQVQGRFLNLSVETKCAAGEISRVIGSAALSESFELRCDAPLDYIEINGLDRTMVDTMVNLHFFDGSTENHLISARQPSLSLAQSSRALPAYMRYGIEHLLLGFDHVFFVIILLYIVRGRVELLKVITSFTVAHSITLALAVFDIVRLPQAPIEALIALSIVMLAAESLRSNKGSITAYPWVLTFVFGLIHGLGFAGALTEIGLPQASAFAALLMFNVGIEIGQLIIVAIGLLAVFLLQRVNKEMNVKVVNLPLCIMGSIASYWFVGRSLQIVF
jgi:hypothetical protein